MVSRLAIRCSFFLLTLAVAAICVGQTTQSAPENLVFNPGFEDGTAGWQLQNNNAKGSAVIDDQVSHTGKRSIRISNNSPFGPNVFFRAYQTITTQPFTTYRITCWVKGDGAGDCFIGGGPGWGTRQAFPQGTFDWKEVSIDWSSGDTAQDFELLLVTQSPTKSCWIDDVQFIAIRTDQAKLDAVRNALQASLNKQKEHLDHVISMAAEKQEAEDPYVKLGVSISRRFIDRIEKLGAKQNMSWSGLQISEVDTVLKQTEDRIENQPHTLPGSLAWSGDGPIRIRDGVFYSTHDGHDRPIYFGGYGAFNAIFTDIPNFHDYGINLIQDGRTGPSSLNANGSPSAEVKNPAKCLEEAAKHGIKVDLLLSPHYFPEWAYKQNPELHNGNFGFIEFNIDHPKSRLVLEQWLKTVVPTVKDQPALFSYCLTNEPAYFQSGKDPFSRPKWIKYLTDVHGQIAKLNTLYNTKYTGFDQVPVPTRFDQPKDLHERRAYFDWCRFNQVNFAEWHRWMNDIIKSIDPKAKTHAKELIIGTLGQGMVHYGIEPELVCEFTDIAGMDNVVGFDNNALTSWPGTDFYYDLVNSFRNQPVFNSEFHFIPDGFPAQTIPLENSRAVMWQGALHHLGAATIWVWEEPGPGLLGSIYLRPGNIYGVGRTMLDANRLAEQVAAINHARPRVALLYSQPSVFWEQGYESAAITLHSQLRFAGEKVTFVTERQLAAGHLPDVDVIITPRATHVADKTIEGLKAFVARGGKLVTCGADDLTFDEYHQKRSLPPELHAVAQIDLSPAGGPQHHDLLAALDAAKLHRHQFLDAKTGAPVAGVEYRIVDQPDGTLIPLINFTASPQTIRLPDSLPGTAIDLITGRELDRNAIQLQPMVPVLARLVPDR